jgi:hypothetical protein
MCGDTGVGQLHEKGLSGDYRALIDSIRCWSPESNQVSIDAVDVPSNGFQKLADVCVIAQADYGVVFSFMGSNGIGCRCVWWQEPLQNMGTNGQARCLRHFHHPQRHSSSPIRSATLLHLKSAHLRTAHIHQTAQATSQALTGRLKNTPIRLMYPVRY